MSLPSIVLSHDHVGVVKVADIQQSSLDVCNDLLRKNHEEYHMFFRDTAGHNHIAHSLLTVLALGGGPKELQDRYDDGTPIQRAMPDIDTAILDSLTDSSKFYAALGEVKDYHTFLIFFEREIAAKGWKEVILEYVFSRTKAADAMLARMYEGAYHPVIHLGLGVEFEQPGIVAEALAQAAAHDDSNIKTFFAAAEALAEIAHPTAKPKPMIDLIHMVRENNVVREAPRWTDFGNKMRDGVVGRALDDISGIASQFRIREEELERRTGEMISTCAFFAGAAQREGRKRKIDFFYMHAVTSSIFFTVMARQSWIPIRDRVRLVEWKGRLDLAWYAVSGSAPLNPSAITSYSNPESDNMGWSELFDAVIKEHDDGHAAKFIRALKNGQDVCERFEAQSEWAGYFPVRGDMWLKVARMCHDTTKNLPTDLKWVPFTGFEQPWKRPDLVS
ncbi:hypothetical protein F4678DRAFT_61829 [Xylaria arbuscula]|nr:hypothetical protein F4678DRAFT_61829 [Xylaria arbuscula]